MADIIQISSPYLAYSGLSVQLSDSVLILPVRGYTLPSSIWSTAGPARLSKLRLAIGIFCLKNGVMGFNRDHYSSSKLFYYTYSRSCNVIFLMAAYHRSSLKHSFVSEASHQSSTIAAWLKCRMFSIHWKKYLCVRTASVICVVSLKLCTWDGMSNAVDCVLR